MNAFDDLKDSPAHGFGKSTKPALISEVKSVHERTIVGFKSDYSNNLIPIYFKDDYWDMNLYKPLTSRCNFYFNFQLYDAPLRHEIKQLCLLWLHWHTNSVSSIKNCLPVHFKSIYNFALSHNISIKETLNDERWIADFVQSAVALTPANFQALKLKIKRIRELQLKDVIDWGPNSDKLYNALSSNNINYKVENQTSVIPSRIYCNLVSGISDILTDFVDQKVAVNIITLFKRINELPYSGGQTEKIKILSHTKQNRGKLKNTQTIESLMHELGLDVWLTRYGSEPNLRELEKMVRVVQLAARLWIHLFTGMRDMEARSLPYICLGKIESHGKQITVIRGLTSKLTGLGAINSMWVTNDIVKVAVEAAQGVARYFAAYHGLPMDENIMPLFPGKGSLGEIHTVSDFKPNTSSLDRARKRLLDLVPNITIQEEDLAELLRFQSFTPDFREKFKVGATWPLHTHQCRRSLSVYTARSNKVSIGAMTAQFKHLTLQMQEYYRRGSIWAVDLLASPAQNDFTLGIRGLVELIEMDERLKQFDDFDERIIRESGPIAGIAGSTFKRLKRDGFAIVLEEDREYTKQAFLDGRTAFKESPIGWCTKRDACDKITITNDTQCIGCENSVFTPRDSKKLKHHIEYLKAVKAPYSAGSMFEKHYSTQIEITEKTLAKIGGDTK